MRFLITLSILLLILLSEIGCSRKVYIPVESSSIIRDSLRFSTIRCDSIILRDSVIIQQKGDTILQTKIRYRERYRSLYDTITQIHYDSIYIEKPLPVTNPTSSGYTKIRNILLLIILIFTLVFFLLLLIRRHPNKI